MYDFKSIPRHEVSCLYLSLSDKPLMHHHLVYRAEMGRGFALNRENLLQL